MTDMETMTPPTQARFAAKTRRDGACLRWTAATTSGGYGLFWDGTRLVLAHRWAYQQAHGPIPEGLEIDHVRAAGCLFRDCVEPSHLEAVTPAENTRRARALITECPSGHAYDEANTIHEGSRRRCRACALRRSADRKRRNQVGGRHG